MSSALAAATSGRAREGHYTSDGSYYRLSEGEWTAHYTEWNTNGEYDRTDYNGSTFAPFKPVTAASLGINKNSSAEALIDGLLRMKVGDYIEGDEIAKINDKFQKASKILDKLIRVKEGLQIDLTWVGKTLLNAFPKAPNIKDNAIITITREAWPDGKNSVLHLISQDIEIYYNNNLVPLNFYINNNGRAMDKVAYPSYYPIMKGKW